MAGILTAKDVARILGITRARVYYALDKAGIQPLARAGGVALYSPDQVPLIQAALKNVRPYVVSRGEFCAA